MAVGSKCFGQLVTLHLVAFELAGFCLPQVSGQIHAADTISNTSDTAFLSQLLRRVLVIVFILLLNLAISNLSKLQEVGGLKAP